MISVGHTLYVLGGMRMRCIPHDEGCSGDGKKLVTSWALNTRTGTWRRIADLPDPPTRGSSSVALGGDLFVISPFGRGPVQQYSPDEDRWQALPVLPAPSAPPMMSVAYTLVSGDGTLIALADHGTGRSTVRDFIFDSASHRWRELPVDPLPISAGRFGFVLDGRLFVYASPNTGRGGPDGAASLDLATGEWRSEVPLRLSHPIKFVRYGGTVVAVPFWGWRLLEFDRDRRTWTRRPAPGVVGGVLAGRELTTGAWGGDQWGDLAHGTWFELPKLPVETGDPTLVTKLASARGAVVLLAGQTGRREPIRQTWIWHLPR